ncbi:unnamed protein product [Ectocarpus fasciculatus]
MEDDGAITNGTMVDAPEQDNSGDPRSVRNICTHTILPGRTPESMRMLAGRLETLVLATGEIHVD